MPIRITTGSPAEGVEILGNLGTSLFGSWRRRARKSRHGLDSCLGHRGHIFPVYLPGRIARVVVTDAVQVFQPVHVLVEKNHGIARVGKQKSVGIIKITPGIEARSQPGRELYVQGPGSVKGLGRNHH